MQYRNPYQHFAKPDKAKLSHQKTSTYFIKGGESISYSKFPSNAIQNNALGAKPPIYVKQELSSSNSQFNGIHSANPVLYKAFPVFKSTGNSAGGNRDLVSLSTSHPMWMQSYTSSPKSQLMLNEANMAQRILPVTGQSISSYSFFSPASRLVRVRPTLESLSSLPDLNKSTTNTKLSLTVHTTTSSEQKKHAYTKINTTSIPNHFWGDSKDLPQLTQELNQKKLLPYKPSINHPVFTELNQQFVNDDFKFSEPITSSPLINSGNVSNLPVFHSMVISPFDRDLKILDHGLISTKASTPIKNTEIKTTEIFLPDNKLFPLNILFTTEDPKALKITDLKEMAHLNYSQISPLSNRIKQFSPIINGDYTSRHNFFTIQDAITFPPYTSSTREANFTTQDVVSNYTSRSTTESCFNKKIDSTEITTKPSQAESVSAVFISSKTKGRRRRPQMRSKNTSFSIPDSTESIKKQAFLTTFNTTDATNGPIKTINQRKKSRLNITETTNLDFTTHIALIPQNTERSKKNKNKIYSLREVSGTDNILPEQTNLLKSSTSLSQTTPSSIKYLYTLTTLSQDDFIPTTFITTTPSQQNFNLKNIDMKLNNSSDNTTKDDSFLQKSPPDSNVERRKTVRHRHRLRSESTKAGMKDMKSVAIIYEGKYNLNTSANENVTKVLPLEAITNFQVKRPTFSVKEFKTRNRVQNRTITSTTTLLPDTYPITLASINSERLPNRKRLLPMIRIKPIGYNISIDSKDEAKLKEVNRDTTKPTIQKDRVDKTTESLRGTIKLQSVSRKSLQKSSPASNFTASRKKTTRPQYNNLRDRIHKYQNNKMKTPDSLDFSDDLLNITLVKSDHDTVSSQHPKLQTAIMKIAKQNNSRKALLADPKTVSAENLIKSDTEKSEQVSLLTRGSSQDFTDKNSNAIFRKIPEYFAIATEDPILPIEAFFPNFKTINQSDNT